MLEGYGIAGCDEENQQSFGVCWDVWGSSSDDAASSGILPGTRYSYLVESRTLTKVLGESPERSYLI